MKTFLKLALLAAAVAGSTAQAHGNTQSTYVYGAGYVQPSIMISAGGAYVVGAVPAYTLPYAYGPYAPLTFGVQYTEINHTQIITVEEPQKVTPVNAPNTATANGIPYRVRPR
jgi:hypothetical protein